ncbi:MAG: class I SAM-dependent rRNA methyltransferase [Acidimicrobiia bacterium]|nr:class I SAM-dependent rRNA methyltransferase [Actinomycetota bacterium]NDB06248.1 class I SAM-dependent rRNA methyltransferase [Acidimicrobiia bacterium]NDD97305.1 class I SAM-dependent rRNA methyltransferase [Actinomycetota bacterium]NDE58752.1 class I SAM-dependent rRNA methyltransferase [Acidimicrobiia bacterium]NDE79822.1 class I SAM-dependent rRNA methyltransferase [Actinomycetota bacterium]
MTSRPASTLYLKADRDGPVKRRHPWVMSGSVSHVTNDPQPGDTVLVVSASGDEMGVASYSPFSTIRARMWSFDPTTIVDEDFVANLVTRSVERREWFPGLESTARLVFGDADGLPGLVVDRYGDVVVMQITTVGVEKWRNVIADILFALPGVNCVYERSDGDDRKREGLDERVGVVRGALPAEVYARENGFTFAVDVESGHKTGFYIDQRNARMLIPQLSIGARVLNVFGYTGSFSVIANRSGATSVTTIDSSAPSLELTRLNARLNDTEPGELIVGDAGEQLRRLRDRRAEFDLIILDPPKFAPTQKNLDRASRAYKDVNLLGAKLLAPGGRLLTFSCSGAVSIDLFQKIVAGAALDAKRSMSIVQRLGQPVDHPVLLSYPESEYLKGLLLQAN